jgi:hypothetical protein
MYVIQHCFICCPSVANVSEDAGIEPRTLNLSGRRSNHSARSHPHSARSHLHSARFHPHSARSHPHSARSHLIFNSYHIMHFIRHQKTNLRKIQCSGSRDSKSNSGISPGAWSGFIVCILSTHWGTPPPVWWNVVVKFTNGSCIVVSNYFNCTLQLARARDLGHRIFVSHHLEFLKEKHVSMYRNVRYLILMYRVLCFALLLLAFSNVFICNY